MSKELVTELFSEAGVELDGTNDWDIEVHSDGFYQRALQGSLGFGESYMDGWWECKALDQMLDRVLTANIESKIRISPILVKSYLKAYFFNVQNKASSKKVIDEHYQLGNDLFEKMLDPYMMYSCGYYKEGVKTLEGAQIAKLDLICKKLHLKPGMKVLDIGCGWGGFEKFAAEHYGVSVVGVTLSENQAAYAREFCKGHDVEIKVLDYRDLEGSFDRIVSIGMFEHVGKKNYPTFFSVVKRVLKDDGLMLLHTIGRDTSTLVTDPWINKYIFPNGQLPSVSQITDAFSRLFVLEDWHNFGADYDKTLAAWHDRFCENWHSLHPQYGDRFYRMWKYYLLSCRAAFRARKIQLWQLVLCPRGLLGGYQSVR